MVTLKQVAEAAGVHYSTAASILNRAGGNSRSSDATRARVTRVAAELGYVADASARALRTRRTRTIGFVAGDIRNPFFAHLATSLESHLNERSYRLLLASHNEASLDSSLAELRGARVDSAIVWTSRPPSTGRGAGTTRLPGAARIVWLGLCGRGPGRIDIPIRSALGMVVRHASNLRRSHLVYYAPRGSHGQDEGPRRLRALAPLAKAAGLNVTPVYYDGGSWDLSAARRGAATARGAVDGLGDTVVVGFNDVAALGWHLARPQDQVVGFDGTPLFRAVLPHAPSVDLQIDEIASLAAEAAVRLAEERDPTLPVRIEPLWREPT